MAQFSCTTSEKELYYHQKVNIRFTAEQLKKLGNFKEIPEIPAIGRQVSSQPASQKKNFDSCAAKFLEIAVKHSIGKSITA